MYRHSCLIETYASPEKYWLMCIGPLAIHLFKEGIHFSPQWPHGGSRMSCMPCRCILFLAGPMHGGRAARLDRHCLDFHLQNGPDREVQRVQATQESGIPLRTARWSWWCGPALNPPEDKFSVRICPLDPEDQKLSHQLLVNVGFDCSPAKTGYRWSKSARPTLIPLALLLSDHWSWHQVPVVI